MIGRALIARRHRAIATLMTFLLCATAPAYAQDLTFALIPKDIEDPNFISAWRGCADAARKNGDDCKQIGDTQVGYFRGQLDAINWAVNLGVDGMAISVTNSEFIAETGLPAAKASGIPIITFDSDLEAQHQHFRRSYIGPDNFAIGRQLGQLLQDTFPDGATFCIMSGGRFDPNLNARIEGIRDILRGTNARSYGAANSSAPENVTLIPLDGANGWQEHTRCPLYNRGDQELAQKQFIQANQKADIDVIVPVGSWLLDDPAGIQDILNRFAVRTPKLIMATGSPSPLQDQLTSRGIIDAYVAIDFYAMGALVYQQLRNYALGTNVVVAEESLLEIRRSSALRLGESGQ
jgi:ribose transport system substrate-binding protein